VTYDEMMRLGPSCMSQEQNVKVYNQVPSLPKEFFLDVHFGRIMLKNASVNSVFSYLIIRFILGV